MKKIMSLLIMTILLGHSSAFAKIDDIEKHKTYWYEDSGIWEKYQYNSDDILMQRDLRKCADGGNYMCSSSIGNILFDKEKYAQAYPFLLAASKKYDGVHDEILGQMYGKGTGVLLNYDKAIYHFKKAAKDGSFSAAYNLSWIYEMKSRSCGAYNSKDYAARRYNRVRAHAWARVASALGQKECHYTNGDSADLSTHINEDRELLGRLGWLSEANQISAEICSSVKGCNQ